MMSRVHGASKSTHPTATTTTVPKSNVYKTHDQIEWNEEMSLVCCSCTGNGAGGRANRDTCCPRKRAALSISPLPSGNDASERQHKEKRKSAAAEHRGKDPEFMAESMREIKCFAQGANKDVRPAPSENALSGYGSLVTGGAPLLCHFFFTFCRDTRSPADNRREKEPSFHGFFIYFKNKIKFILITPLAKGSRYPLF